MVSDGSPIAANLAWLSRQQACRARKRDLTIGLQDRRGYDRAVAVNFYPLLSFCKISLRY